MKSRSIEQIQEGDRRHVWHPYAPLTGRPACLPVRAAQGVRLQLADGRELIDGMASWWCAIHGYNHPVLNQAITDQLQQMAHVMFGGLTHEPAVELAQMLVKRTPEPLQSVFFCDSGSVAVEVAIKMALQFWFAQDRPAKRRLLTLRHGYHGDTFGAMSVCDPVNGMHRMFTGTLPEQIFVDAPTCRHDDQWDEDQIAPMQQALDAHHEQLAAVILEPLVQGAGGMRFYCPEYLRRVRALCDQYHVLLIADEIATGFGRTGRLFACQHAEIAPDILCVGKALTGGYLSLAATLTTPSVEQVLSTRGPGVLMHGPTFMANPLACAVARASLQLLEQSPWPTQVAQIEAQLHDELAPCRQAPGVADVRVLGAIGVIEMQQPVDVVALQKQLVARGVWLRPFRNLIYTMPPFVISPDDLSQVTAAMRHAVGAAGE